MNILSDYENQANIDVEIAKQMIKKSRSIKRVTYCLKQIEKWTETSFIDVSDLEIFTEITSKMGTTADYVLVKIVATIEAVQMNTDISDTKIEILEDIDQDIVKIVNSGDFRFYLSENYTADDFFPRERCLYGYENVDQKFYAVFKKEDSSEENI